MNPLIFKLLLLIPMGQHEGRQLYSIVDTETNKVIENAYIEEIKAYCLTGKFEYDEETK
jgi:hypothetical protein